MKKRPRTGFLANDGRATHTYVIGQPGTGKSRAMESWILQDILAGRGVGLIDPHGDLFDHVLTRVAQLALYQPHLAEKVVIVNPCDPVWAVGFNPLQPAPGMTPERVAWFLTDVIVKIWRVDPAAAPRLFWLLVNTLLALCELGLTLAELPRFLRDQMWRESLIPMLRNPQAQAYFLMEFPKTPGAIHQWVQPVINKIGAFIFDPDVRAIVGQTQSTINFRDILDRQLIMLVNLPKGILGEENSRLLAAFLVAQFQKAALSRADSGQREPYYLYLDEFQNYTTDNIQDVLSESRKYSLSLIMAHQYLAQLDVKLRQAVLNTSGTIISFRVGHHDARELVPEMFPIPLTATRKELNVLFMGNWPFPWVRTTEETVPMVEAAGLLTRLRPREFWVKRRDRVWPTRHRSLTVPDPSMTPEVRESLARLIAISGSLYGAAKQDTRQPAFEPQRLLLGAPAPEHEDTGIYYD